ncbi:hypothetical protein Pyn_13855 [Prunus yedoensis var. nudiflora]|uniref:Uncharacterized protein n=1 Tax=Prunus yedoensis var. nudiflora TaxID=2094558 RepID=A0A314YA90_PRUYE|nr:hypothetical protein Pyn_13855 [Prunus yedoensis var. nudiflora]
MPLPYGLPGCCDAHPIQRFHVTLHEKHFERLSKYRLRVLASSACCKKSWTAGLSWYQLGWSGYLAIEMVFHTCGVFANVRNNGTQMPYGRDLPKIGLPRITSL